MRCGWRSWRWSEGLLGLDWGGSSSRVPTYFLCFAKESRQRKATPGRAPVRRLRRRGCPVLLASPGRPGNSRQLRCRSNNRAGLPPGWLRCSARFTGEVNRLGATGGVLILLDAEDALFNAPQFNVSPPLKTTVIPAQAGIQVFDFV